MLSTTTIPFQLPPQGVKIAIKVIDRTGMEHMTVIDDPTNMLEDSTPIETKRTRKVSRRN